MAEAGGPATQAGIYYQNSIAALYLGRMLDLRPRPARHRVLHVRVEAPEEVDDLVVGLGDGSRRFIQAKRTLSTTSDAWSSLWTSFWRQAQSSQFGPDDRLTLTVGEASSLAADLRACSERSIGSASAVEMIAAHGTREAFDSLLDIHDRARDGHLRGAVLDLLEPLAGRLGIRVRRSGARLEAAAT